MKKDPIELSAGIVMLWSSRWEKNKENKAVMEGDVLTRNITNWDGSDMAQDMKALQQLIQTSQNIIGTHMSAQSPKEAKQQHQPQPQSVHLAKETSAATPPDDYNIINFLCRI